MEQNRFDTMYDMLQHLDGNLTRIATSLEALLEAITVRIPVPKTEPAREVFAPARVVVRPKPKARAEKKPDAKDPK